MYKWLRNLHKIIGLICCLFLCVISLTGFFLAMKSRFGWIRPDAQAGTEFAHPSELAPIHLVLDAAFAAGFSEVKVIEDIDRLEFHAEDRIWKILSKEGFREIQIDGVTTEVLSRGQRNDQMLEQLHDMSFFSDWLHDLVLPLVAGGLFLLSLSGVIMYMVPVFRRWKFNRRQKLQGKPAS